MQREQNQQTPEWQKFIDEDDKRLKAQQDQEAEVLAPLSSAKSKSTEAEPKNPTQEKYPAMYADFADLPEDVQGQIIAEVTAKRDQGEDPKELISRVINLVKAHKDFLELGDKSKDRKTEKEKWRKELDEILDEMRKIKSTPKDKKPEDRKKAKPSKWVQ